MLHRHPPPFTVKVDWTLLSAVLVVKLAQYLTEFFSSIPQLLLDMLQKLLTHLQLP